MVFYSFVYLPSQVPKWEAKYKSYISDFNYQSRHLFEENSELQQDTSYTVNAYFTKKEKKEAPILLMRPTQYDNYVILATIDNNEVRDFIVKDHDVIIRLLYMKDDKKFNYYLTYHQGNETHYIELDDYIEYRKGNNEMYGEITIEDTTREEDIFTNASNNNIRFELSEYSSGEEFVKYLRKASKTNNVSKAKKDTSTDNSMTKVEPVETEEVEDDPGNCNGTDPNASSNPCMCEEFNGCINDSFERQVCGIGKCTSKNEMSQEECDSYGGELSNGYCYTDYK